MMHILIVLGLLAAPLLAAESETALQARDLIVHRCGICHRGPFLDLSQYPFFSDRFTDERSLLSEGLRRARLTDGKRMPPVNYPALSEAELHQIESYLSELGD